MDLWSHTMYIVNKYIYIYIYYYIFNNMIHSPSSHGVKLLTKTCLGHPNGVSDFLPRHPLGPAEVNPPSIAGGPGRFVIVGPSWFGGGAVGKSLENHRKKLPSGELT